MQAFVQRRRDGQPGPAAEEPAGPPPTALLLPHHGKAKSAPPLGVAAADWGPEGDGMGAGNGRGRGRGRALKWGASLALLLLLLLRYHPEGRGHIHTAFVTVEDTRVGAWVVPREQQQAARAAAHISEVKPGAGTNRAVCMPVTSLAPQPCPLCTTY